MMRKVGFVLEIGALVVVLGGFALSRGGWLEKKVSGTFSEGQEVAQSEMVQDLKEEAADTAEGQAVAQAAAEPEEKAAENMEADANTPAGRAAALGLPVPPEIDINSWEYVLVNGEHKLDASFVPEIGVAVSQTSESNQDVRIVEALNRFVKDAETQGLEVYLSSGYRSYETQEMLFEMKCEEYDYDTAATIVAIPGTSEHQSGLCCDITDIYRSPKNSELENTETYKWMSAHCAEYGFIVRFPKGKEDITKIIYEPWHFRYVGVDAAKYIMENELTLEEFVPLYKA